MIGQKYGKLEVLELKEKIKNPCKSARGFIYVYSCLCECGNTVAVRQGNLKSGHTQSCGCLKKESTRNFMENKHQLSGMVFGRLTVQNRNLETFLWNCLCECGNETTASTDYLNAGKKRSCGCLQTDMSSNYLKQYHKDYRLSLGKDPDELLTPDNDLQRSLFRETAKEILARDYYQCIWCSKQNTKLEVHHIQKWSTNESLRFEHNNLCTLCPDCHKKVHINGYHAEPNHLMNIFLQGYVNIVEEDYFDKCVRIELTPN